MDPPPLRGDRRPREAVAREESRLVCHSGTHVCEASGCRRVWRGVVGWAWRAGRPLGQTPLSAVRLDAPLPANSKVT